MKTKKVELGSQNQITKPNLHDSNITKIEFLEDSVAFYFKLVTDQTCCIEFSGEVYLRCDNVLEGNIIFDVVVHPAGDACMEWVEDVNSFSFKEVGEQQKLHYETTLKKFQDGELKLVSINPSYGCEGIITCKNITYFICEK